MGVADDLRRLNGSLGFFETARILFGSDNVASDITNSYMAFRNSAGRSKKVTIVGLRSSATSSEGRVVALSTLVGKDQSSGSLLLRRSFLSILLRK